MPACVSAKIYTTLAPLSSLLRERGIPISYITTGQRVPEDLDRATPVLLANAILSESYDETAVRS